MSTKMPIVGIRVRASTSNADAYALFKKIFGVLPAAAVRTTETLSMCVHDKIFSDWETKPVTNPFKICDCNRGTDFGRAFYRMGVYSIHGLNSDENAKKYSIPHDANFCRLDIIDCDDELFNEIHKMLTRHTDYEHDESELKDLPQDQVFKINELKYEALVKEDTLVKKIDSLIKARRESIVLSALLKSLPQSAE
jgi:hypothetical protein